MHRLTAINKARKLWGPAALARDEGTTSAMTPEQRAKAKSELDALQAEKPEGWKTRVQALRAQIVRRRFTVGVRRNVCGLPIFDVKGSGDSFEEAFTQAGVKN